MRVAPLGLLLASLGISIQLLGCVTSEIPGEDRGSHRFEGLLVENSCGPTAVPARDLIEIDVQLRSEDSLAVWRPLGSPILLGTLSEQGDWRLRSASTVGLTGPDPLTGNPGCQLEQLETIVFSTDTETSSDDVRYLGTSTVLFAPSQGANCLNTLAIQGGTFLEFPCEVTYELTSQEIDDLFPGERDGKDENASPADGSTPARQVGST